jgi:hypothetical protein
MHLSNYGWGLFVLVMSVSLSPQAFAQINTVNNGPVINSGTYRNTADSKTTFTNTVGGGLWLKSGSNIRGLRSIQPGS